MADHVIPNDVGTVNGGSNYSRVRPGDRLLIPAGRRGQLLICNLQGEPGKRIVIINDGGQVKITTNEPECIVIENCQHIRLTGTGDPDIEYGFDLYGFPGAGLRAREGTEYIEIDHLEIHHSSGRNGAGLRCHSRSDEVPSGWVQHDTYIHHIYVHDVNREAFYLGHPDNDRGVAYDGIEVAHCRIERIGWEGYQIKNGRDNCHVHHNYAESVGLQCANEQNEPGTAYVIGPQTGGSWHDNVAVNCNRGIHFDNHREGTEVYNNLVVNSGLFKAGEGIVRGEGIRQMTSSPALIHHNTVVDSDTYGIRITSSASQGEIRDNIVAKSGNVHIRTEVPTRGNVEADTIEEVRFVDPEGGVYYLREDSPARGQACDGGDPGAFPYGPPPVGPQIDFFGVSAQEVQVGTEVELVWKVSGETTDIQIRGPDFGPLSGLSAEGSIPFTPPEAQTYPFVLIAYNGGLSARATVELTAYPSPVPGPSIDLFKVSAQEVQVGTEVELSWKVSGETTDIQIRGPDFGPLSGLSAEGSIPFTPSEAQTYLFVLTAYNGDLSASQIVELRALPTAVWPSKEEALDWFTRLHGSVQEVAAILSEAIARLEE